MNILLLIGVFITSLFGMNIIIRMNTEDDIHGFQVITFAIGVTMIVASRIL